MLLIRKTLLVVPKRPSFWIGVCFWKGQSRFRKQDRSCHCHLGSCLAIHTKKSVALVGPPRACELECRRIQSIPPKRTTYPARKEFDSASSASQRRRPCDPVTLLPRPKSVLARRSSPWASVFRTRHALATTRVGSTELVTTAACATRLRRAAEVRSAAVCTPPL